MTAEREPEPPPAAGPTEAEAQYRLGRERRMARDLAGAEQPLRRALELAPGHADATFELALALLGLGRFAEAWPLYEQRELRRRRGAFMGRNYAYPEWRGEPLAGKRLLVIGEQGFGDQIMMARFLPRLGAGAITYAGPAELARLFSQLPLDYLRTDQARTRPQADYWIFAMSLPARLAADVEDLPAPPYFTGNAGSRTGRVGVVARGAPYNPNDRFRSLPETMAAELLALPGAVGLEPGLSGAADFQDTADIIAGLDLVVSVDTAVAHLAGAMGKPVWVLLAAHGLDWHWMEAGTASPWYPSARLLRQSAPGDWRGVLDRVKAELGG